MAAPERNLEIKARDPDPPRSLELALELGAEDHGEIEQGDTYFGRVGGRLKLREQTPGETELIHYRRPDETGPRNSDYRRVPVDAAEDLRAGRWMPRSAPSSSARVAACCFGRACGSTLDEVEGLGSRRRGGRAAGRVPALRRLSPAPGRVRQARNAGLPRRARDDDPGRAAVRLLERGRQRLPAFSESLAVLFQTLPYVLVLIVVAGLIGRSRPPAAIGVPYVKE